MEKEPSVGKAAAEAAGDGAAKQGVIIRVKRKRDEPAVEALVLEERPTKLLKKDLDAAIDSFRKVSINETAPSSTGGSDSSSAAKLATQPPKRVTRRVFRLVGTTKTNNGDVDSALERRAQEVMELRKQQSKLATPQAQKGTQQRAALLNEERKQSRFQNIHKLRLISSQQGPGSGLAVLDLVNPSASSFSSSSPPPSAPAPARPSSQTTSRFGKSYTRPTTMIVDELPKVKTLKEIRAEQEAKMKAEEEYEIDYYVIDHDAEEDEEELSVAAVVGVESFHMSMLGNDILVNEYDESDEEYEKDDSEKSVSYPSTPESSDNEVDEDSEDLGSFAPLRSGDNGAVNEREGVKMLQQWMRHGENDDDDDEGDEANEDSGDDVKVYGGNGGDADDEFDDDAMDY